MLAGFAPDQANIHCTPRPIGARGAGTAFGLAALAFAAASTWTSPASAATCNYYVNAVSGSDSYAGTSLAAPFRSLNKAAITVPAGGTVCVMSGTYSANASSGAVLDIRRSGSDTAYTTYMAYPGEHPVIKTPMTSWNGILLQGVHHIVVDGFEVIGDAQSISQETANAYKSTTSYIPTNQSGIGVNRFSGQITPHHIVLRNNIVHHAPCSGIQVVHADWVTIENNEAYANSWWSPSACSGISVYENQAVDSVATYKVVLRNNSSHDNANLVPNVYTGTITDGNGLIIDDNRNTQGPGNGIAYAGRTKVENNVFYNNGGSGAHAFYSQHVDFVNNTSYWNYKGKTNQNGEIFANGSGDVNFYNNVMVGSGGVVKKNWTSNMGPVTYDYNVYWNGTVTGAGLHDVKADPAFASTVPGAAGFLYPSAASSATIDTGSTTLAPNDDRNYKLRTAVPDRGAYEY
jgi:hypothetical protein